jgi:hypothetical protein
VTKMAIVLKKKGVLKIRDNFQKSIDKKEKM